MAWPYLKVECAPPMCVALLQGPVGKAMENAASGVSNGIIGFARSQINSMNAAVEKKRLDAEAAITAAQEMAKVEEKKKRLVAEQKAAAAQKEALKKAPKKPPESAKKAAEPAKKTPDPAKKPTNVVAQKPAKKDPKKK